MLMDGLRMLFGPLPLSLLVHALLLTLLLTMVHNDSGRRFIRVELSATGGSGSTQSRMAEWAMPEVPIASIVSEHPFEFPEAVDVSKIDLGTSEYVRQIPHGIETGSGGGIGGGIGTGYGNALGSGFGGYIGVLRHKGLDVVLVIDGTGSMLYIMDAIKSRMKQLAAIISRLVPIARIGIVVFGGRGEPISIQPLTHSQAAIANFLSGIVAQNGGVWQEDTFNAVQTAATKMAWSPTAKRVIVLIGDTPPFDEDYDAVLLLAQRFGEEGGVLNTIDVTEFEHERWEMANCTLGECGPGYEDVYIRHRKKPPMKPLWPFYLQTRRAYQTIAEAGGGTMGVLNEKVEISQEILILAFGQKWQQEIGAFGRPLTTTDTN